MEPFEGISGVVTSAKMISGNKDALHNYLQALFLLTAPRKEAGRKDSQKGHRLGTCLIRETESGTPCFCTLGFWSTP